mmetsp:Transcript_45497/g.116421  ORF Transcript_45497/g.116421 Transcript_45497/m.116421 type:complete len:283 (-) Transcript_45497:708-1556(-)
MQTLDADVSQIGAADAVLDAVALVKQQGLVAAGLLHQLAGTDDGVAQARVAQRVLALPLEVNHLRELHLLGGIPRGRLRALGGARDEHKIGLLARRKGLDEIDLQLEAGRALRAPLGIEADADVGHVLGIDGRVIAGAQRAEGVERQSDGGEALLGVEARGVLLAVAGLQHACVRLAIAEDPHEEAVRAVEKALLQVRSHFRVAGSGVHRACELQVACVGLRRRIVLGFGHGARRGGVAHGADVLYRPGLGVFLFLELRHHRLGAAGPLLASRDCPLIVLIL